MSEEEAQALKERVARLEALTETLMLLLWSERGELKSMVANREKKLDKFFQEYLDSKKSGL